MRFRHVVYFDQLMGARSTPQSWSKYTTSTNNITQFLVIFDPLLDESIKFFGIPKHFESQWNEIQIFYFYWQGELVHCHFSLWGTGFKSWQGLFICNWLIALCLDSNSDLQPMGNFYHLSAYQTNSCKIRRHHLDPLSSGSYPQGLMSQAYASTFRRNKCYKWAKGQ